MDVKRGKEMAVREALKEDRFLAHAHNEMKQTPLIIAAKRNHLSIARILIENKADVLAADQNGKTARYYASVHGHTELLHMLLIRISSIFTHRHN